MRMVMVTLWGTLRAATDGRAEVEIEASTFKELLDKLSVEYPGLAPQIKRGVSLGGGWQNISRGVVHRNQARQRSCRHALHDRGVRGGSSRVRALSKQTETKVNIFVVLD